MENYPLRIHRDLLPKKLGLKGDADGFIHGYLCITESDYAGAFMNDEVIFKMLSQPILTHHTHRICRYICTVEVGMDKSGRKVGELCSLTFFFNSHQ